MSSHLPPKVQNELIEKIKAIKPREIWLFGSYAKGTPTISSDIDIFVIKKKIKEDFHDDVVALRNELNKLQKEYGIEIDLFIDTKKGIKEKLKEADPFYISVFKDAEQIYKKKPTTNNFIKIPPRQVIKFRIFMRKLKRFFKRKV
ncbi:MAG: nucleotidyltransferase domain-containing protein [Campylobacteraceae bacterium]|nr:nucleotidyltransferase domain-containing protein [Campylobacteraceae bacterium]